jgi:hypothetical protein
MIMPDTVLTKFPPLQERKHPALAGLIGVLTGGIGLAVYFKSLRDLLPVELAGGLVMAGSLVAATNRCTLPKSFFRSSAASTGSSGRGARIAAGQHRPRRRPSASEWLADLWLPRSETR